MIRYLGAQQAGRFIRRDRLALELLCENCPRNRGLKVGSRRNKRSGIGREKGVDSQIEVVVSGREGVATPAQVGV
jgi:hypothetical protein